MRPHGKNIIVGCLYRPPDASLTDFNRSVEDILSAISFENKLSYIIGDFNINILNSHSHQPTNEFINLMTSNSLYPLISKPTRITYSTATLIDNIFTNNLELNMNSGILYTDLSDHLPVFQVTHLKMIVEPPRQKRFVRLINSTTMSAFRSKLEGVDWSSVYSINSVNLMTHSLVFLLRHTLCHFLFNLHVLNLTALQNPGSQMANRSILQNSTS